MKVRQQERDEMIRNRASKPLSESDKLAYSRWLALMPIQRASDGTYLKTEKEVMDEALAQGIDPRTGGQIFSDKASRRGSIDGGVEETKGGGGGGGEDDDFFGGGGGGGAGGAGAGAGSGRGGSAGGAGAGAGSGGAGAGAGSGRGGGADGSAGGADGSAGGADGSAGGDGAVDETGYVSDSKDSEIPKFEEAIYDDSIGSLHKTKGIPAERRKFYRVLLNLIKNYKSVNIVKDKDTGSLTFTFSNKGSSIGIEGGKEVVYLESKNQGLEKDFIDLVNSMQTLKLDKNKTYTKIQEIVKDVISKQSIIKT
jgi:hypothetical protein